MRILGVFKDSLYKSIKEKADPSLYQHYREERTILDDDIINFYGLISKEAREFFESYILTQLNYLGELEKDYIFDYTFLELNKVWRELIFGDVDIFDILRECEEGQDV